MRRFRDVFRTLTVDDVLEADEVVETTSVPGLYWIRNYGLRSAKRSRVVFPSQGQGTFSVVYHASDFSHSSHGGYDYYGIHLGQTDVLTFLATDDREMRGQFVDCRARSGTLHQHCELKFSGDPDSSLVIERGIAHIFDNLIGMITLNQMRTYIDFKNPDASPNIDVLSVPRDTNPQEFPSVRVNRYRAPAWFCRASVKAQRIMIRTGNQSRAVPLNIRVGDKLVTLTRAESAQ